MMIPDYSLIAEIMLFAEGFETALPLSRKMTRLYRLASEQLSQQKHYDYGLRAVKSVLVMAGALKRRSPSVSEDVVLIRAIRDSNLPKFVAEDVVLFEGIVGDLFPGVTVTEQSLGPLTAAIESQLRAQGLQAVDTFKAKVVQLHNTMDVRFGVTVVGPAASGKSCTWKALSAARTAVGAATGGPSVAVTVLNPKCVSMEELYGRFDELTQLWTDGLAARVMREAANAPDARSVHRWTVFDGPIDSKWIENMNTVLDDNMMLCLSNGERVRLEPNMRLIFEVSDLQMASPATVSRLGVVYVAADTVGWMPFVQSWLQSPVVQARTSPDVRERLAARFQSVVRPLLVAVKKDVFKGLAPLIDMHLVANVCWIFQAYNLQDGVASPFLAQGTDTITTAKATDRALLFSAIWAVGVSLATEHWPAFDALVRKLIETERLDVGLPSGGLCFDQYLSFEAEGAFFRPWRDTVPSFSYDPQVSRGCVCGPLSAACACFSAAVPPCRSTRGAPPHTRTHSHTPSARLLQRKHTPSLTSFVGYAPPPLTSSFLPTPQWRRWTCSTLWCQQWTPRALHCWPSACWAWAGRCSWAGLRDVASLSSSRCWRPRGAASPWCAARRPPPLLSLATAPAPAGKTTWPGLVLLPLCSRWSAQQSPWRL
jgi:dynein heavy chain